jgi:hypothetical protein
MPEWSASKSNDCALGFFGSLMDLVQFAFRTTLPVLSSVKLAPIAGETLPCSDNISNELGGFTLPQYADVLSKTI